MRLLAFVVLVALCGCEGVKREPPPSLRYVWRPMDEENAYLFKIDPACRKSDGNDLNSFRRDLDAFTKENPHLDVKNWEIIQFDSVSIGDRRSYNIAAKIVVFTRANGKPKVVPQKKE